MTIKRSLVIDCGCKRSIGQEEGEPDVTYLFVLLIDYNSQLISSLLQFAKPGPSLPTSAIGFKEKGQ